jgi:hypothetical protein
MPRPQFSIRTLLWLTLIAAIGSAAWVSINPLPTWARLLVEIVILLAVVEVACIAKISRLKRDGKIACRRQGE